MELAHACCGSKQKRASFWIAHFFEMNFFLLDGNICVEMYAVKLSETDGADEHREVIDR